MKMRNLLILLSFLTLNTHAQWTQQYFRGYVNLFHADNQQLFCAVDSSRIYRSTDQGATWVERNAGLPGAALVTDFALRNNTIIVSAEASASAQKGLYRSTDLGQTWTKISGLPGQNFTLLHLVDSTWYAGCTGVTANPLYYSNNEGVTWTNATGLTGSTRVSSIVNKGTQLILSADNGIFSSTDKGQTWTKITTTGLPAGTTFSAMVVTGGNQFIGYTNEYSSPALYSSSNAAAWSALPVAGLPAGANIWEFYQSGGLLYTITFAEGSTTRLFRSSDNGNTWTEVATTTLKKFSGKFFRNGTRFAVAGSSFFAATAQGMYKSTNDGTNWTEASTGIRYNGYLEKMAAANNWLFALSGSSLFQNSVYPGGFSEVPSFPFKNSYVMDFVSLNNVLYAANDAKLVKSANTGATWDSVAVLPSGLSIGKVFVGNNKLYVYGSKSSGTLKYISTSTNSGAAWDTFRVANTAYFSSLDAAYNKVYAGAYDGIFEAGATLSDWTTYGKTGIPAGSNFNISFPSDTNMMLVALQKSPTTNIYYTTNKGGAWTKATVSYGPVTGDTIPSVSCFLNVNGKILCGTASGIFLSLDKGKTWSDYRGNMGPLYINYLYNTGKYVLASTAYYSAWFISTGSVKADDELPIPPEDYSLRQNYPNPFNPSTTIRFHLRKNAAVTLRVFNTLGQEVSTVLHKALNPGTHEVSFDAGTLPSGTYIYRLEADGACIQKKMMLLR